MTDLIQGTQEPAIVSSEALARGEPRAATDSNVEIVNRLQAELFELRELSHEALLNYYVDYYLVQVNNGGFSQFVYNSHWNTALVALVKEGLTEIGATRHAVLFERGAARVGDPAFPLSAFLDRDYWGENDPRDHLDEISNAFMDIEKGGENLEALNEVWLRTRPNLIAMPEQELAAHIAHQALALPDREARRARALAAEPRYKKIIRALCAASGHVLDRVTAGNPRHVHGGVTVLAWHFLTDRGHYYMIEVGDRALMFGGANNNKITELEWGGG